MRDRETFKVPSDYFETLSDRIMSNLPAEEFSVVEELVVDTPVISLWEKLKPLTYLAAMFVGAALLIRVAMPTKVEDTNELANQYNIEEVTDQFIQEIVDGAMLDDYTLHLYLTDNGE